MIRFTYRTLRRVARRAKQIFLRAPTRELSVPDKRAGELAFWSKEIERYVRWMKGEIPQLYGIPSPTQREIVLATTVRESAILTWATMDQDKYLRHLRVGPDFLSGRYVLEIGCGPLPYAMCFRNCTVLGLDPLLIVYKDVGYPLQSFGGRIQFVCAQGERIPLCDRSVDAVISVNAIDHTENFPAVCTEIDRVLVPNGILRIEMHYHPARPLEPWQLNDEIVRSAFRRRVLKVSEVPYSAFYPEEHGHETEKLVTWASSPVS